MKEEKEKEKEEIRNRRSQMTGGINQLQKRKNICYVYIINHNYHCQSS